MLLNLEKYYPDVKRIHVILDNARYHYSEAVRKALATSKIHLIFLPPYSPELNLIERLWHVFKKNILYNKFYKRFSDFKNACYGFFNNYHQYYDDISSIVGDGLDALITEGYNRSLNLEQILPYDRAIPSNLEEYFIDEQKET